MKLAQLIESRNEAIDQLARIDTAIRNMESRIIQQSVERSKLAVDLTEASVTLALDGTGQELVDTLTQWRDAANRAGLQDISTLESLRIKREQAETAVKMAKLAVAQEVQHVATPEWNEATVGCLAAWSAFLSAVRQRCQIGSTATSYFAAAGSNAEPFDEQSVLVASFAGVGGLSDGLLDIVRENQLQMTSRGLGFLPGNSIQLLSEADLLKLAEREADAK